MVDRFRPAEAQATRPEPAAPETSSTKIAPKAAVPSPGVDTFEAAPQNPIARAHASGIDAANEILPNLKSVVKKHAIESALAQLTTEINKPGVKIPQQVAGKITDKKQLLGQLVNAYATMPDLRPMMQKAVPQITDAVDRLNKLQGLS